MRIGIIITALLVCLASAAPSGDKMTTIPVTSPNMQGYPVDYNTSIYTGYLDLGTEERGMHYVFVESIKGANNSDPVTLWLNGGPGCSSLLGFIQEIGPYYLQEGKTYKEGENLTKNQHSWHQISNLLFLESPTGVGYSYNTNTSFRHNDATTGNDNLNAVLSFFEKFSEYRKNKFWIAGESYAGKYIPYLATLIDGYNQYRAEEGKKIDFRGILIGNGLMDYSTIQSDQVQYLMGHSLLNPEIRQYWSACRFDPDSAGCGFFTVSLYEDIDEVNPYNVYGYCYYNDSFGQTQKRKTLTQESILLGIQNQMSSNPHKTEFNGAPCAYFDGMLNYFNLHEKEFKAKWDNQHWNGPCAENITYSIDPKGSMHDYRYLLGRLKDLSFTIHLYNGNWDFVIPAKDTVSNIKKLDLIESYLYTPWFTNDQHSGFMQIYSGVIFTIVKGASHQVPQSKRPEALNLFNMTLSGHADMLMKEAFKEE